MKWLTTSQPFIGLLEISLYNFKILKEMLSLQNNILKKHWLHWKVLANLIKILKKKIKSENYWLHFSRIETVLLWFAHLLMKLNFKIWTLSHLRSLDLISLNKSYHLEKESLKDWKSKPSMESSWMVKCIATWCPLTLVLLMREQFLTLKMLGIICANNNVKKFKMIVKLFLTKNSETIWNSL